MEALSRNIILDGHSASGKSAVAAAVADRFGLTVVRPFDDKDAAELLAYEARGQTGALGRRAREILARVDGAVGTGPVVFDRHWLSVAVRLPDHFLDAWPPVSGTYLCWADLGTTLRRLQARAPHEPDPEFHRHYVDRYRQLAIRYGIPIIDTSSLTVDEAVELLSTRIATRA